MNPAVPVTRIFIGHHSNVVRREQQMKKKSVLPMQDAPKCHLSN